jgi:flagellin-like hook-associated protein FlgL
MDSEELLLKDFLSDAQDTDVARSTLDLKKAENALHYTLQVGATLLQQSLFDFIA